MPDLHNHILSKLEEQRFGPNLKPNALRLLNWATGGPGHGTLFAAEPNLGKHKALVFGCFRVLVYRRLPLSQTEARELGTTLTSLIARVREHIRSMFFAPELLERYIAIDPSCSSKKLSRSTCRRVVIQGITENFIVDPSISGSRTSELDIFENLSSGGMCESCTPEIVTSIETLKEGKLDAEIAKCIGMRKPAFGFVTDLTA